MSGDTVILTPVINALTSTVTPSIVIGIFAQVVTIALPFILTWFACRFLYKTFKRAIAGRER